tara:strand:- start:84 stop:314 length:231 start_codon:yes stop_codon:yes gene_type:complete
MIKVTTSVASKEHEYPVLMLHKTEGTIVMFMSELHGVVVREGINDSRKSNVGYHLIDWFEEDFTIFHGVVSLENES